MRGAAAVASLGAVLSLVACTRMQEEVWVSNPCDTEISVWLSAVPPPPGSDDYGLRIEAASSTLLNHDPDEPIQQIWVSVGGSDMYLVEDNLDFSEYQGDAIASYRLPISVCAAAGS